MLAVSDCSAICPSRPLLNRGGEGQGIYGGGPGPTIGALTLHALALYLAACSLSRGVLRLWGHPFALPHLRDAMAQVALGAADNALAIGAFWMLLPPRAVMLPRFIVDYSVAYVGGALSGVPGGAGPFEGLLVKLLPTLDKTSLAAAFLGFRLIFNLAPLILAAVLFAVKLLRPRDGWPLHRSPSTPSSERNKI